MTYDKAVIFVLLISIPVTIMISAGFEILKFEIVFLLSYRCNCIHLDKFSFAFISSKSSRQILALYIMALSYRTMINQKMVKPAEHKFPLIFSSLFLVGIWSLFSFLCLRQYFRQSHVVLKSLWTSCKYLRGQFLKGKLLNKVSFYQSIKLLINEECLSSEELQRVFWWRWAFFLAAVLACGWELAGQIRPAASEE